MTTEEQRIALAEEAESLPIHVRMCAMRHGQIVGKIDAQDRRLSRIEKAAWAILATLAGGGALTAAQVAPVLQALAGHG